MAISIGDLEKRIEALESRDLAQSKLIAALFRVLIREGIAPKYLLEEEAARALDGTFGPLGHQPDNPDWVLQQIGTD